MLYCVFKKWLCGEKVIDWRKALCKSVFYHTPTYYMSIFLIPEKMIHKVVRLLRKFFWKGHSRGKFINGKVVSCLQEDGGLGVDGVKLKMQPSC